MTLKDIKPNPRNPRLIKGDRMEKLQEYIAEFGDLSGLVVNSDGTIISGHQRARVFKKEKGKLTILERYEPPQADGTTARGFVELKDGSRFLYRQVDWPSEKADRATIVANGQFGEWDSDILTNEWSFDVPELREFGVPEFVFGGADVNGGVSIEAQEDGYEIPDEIKTDIVLGDLFEIGPHRLYCGDSTSADDVARLLNGDKPRLMVTDPPYGVAYTGKTKAAMKIKNDSMSEAETHSLWRDAFSLAIAEMCEGGAIYATVPAGLLQVGFTQVMRDFDALRQCMVWDKGTMVLGHSDYHYGHEPILYGWTPGAAHYFTSDRTKTTVFRYPRPNRNSDHPTMKPVEMLAEMIANSSREKELVYDPFLGSGTTMVAAHQLNRRCYGMEIDPKYCQVIIDRMLKLDPALNFKRNGNKYVPKNG